MDKLLFFAAGWWVGSRMATGQPIVPAQLTQSSTGGTTPATPSVSGLAGLSYANRGPVRYRRY